MAKLMRDAI